MLAPSVVLFAISCLIIVGIETKIYELIFGLMICFFLLIGISYFCDTCFATVFRPLPVGPRTIIRGVRGAIERGFFAVNE
jgi:hypothetical protein